MSKNKLYNLSYFSKRLIEAGFNINRIVSAYENDDPRKWTILVVNSKTNSYKFNIMITCFKNEKTKEFSFILQGQQPRELTYKTLSMVLITKLLTETMRPSENELIINSDDII
jgi:hypothetical protein